MLRHAARLKKAIKRYTHALLRLRNAALYQYSEGMNRVIPSFEHGWRWWRGNAAAIAHTPVLKDAPHDDARPVQPIRR